MCFFVGFSLVEENTLKKTSLFGGRKGNSELREESGLNHHGYEFAFRKHSGLGMIHCALPASSNPENSQGSVGENMCKWSYKHRDELNKT